MMTDTNVYQILINNTVIMWSIYAPKIKTMSVVYIYIYAVTPVQSVSVELNLVNND